MEGWIKLHRSIIENLIFDNEKLFKVFAWCLIKATHKEHEQLVGRIKVKLLPGQFVTGREKASTELKMAPSTAWEYLKLLENNKSIDIKSNSKFSIVTVTNWELHQSNNVKADSKSTSKQQLINTNKNEYNGKNEKNIYSIFNSYSENESVKQTLNDFIEMRNEINATITMRAATILLNKLNKLATTDDMKIKIIEQSILYNWKSFFPLKEDKNEKPKSIYKEL